LIELQQVSKAYAGRNGHVAALQAVSLQVAAGETFGVIGRSGAGKSTLIRLVNRLEQPTSGRVIVDGQDVVALDPAGLRTLRRRIGMVFQHFNLLSSRTVAQNVAWPMRLAGVAPAEAKRRAGELLDLVGLSARAGAYPAQLSGGQKQRVGIARALANRPNILLCDEATSALDPETTEQILALIAQLKREFSLTVLLITHEMEVVRRICDRVAVLDRGELVEVGPAAEVFLHPQTAAAKSLVEEAEGADMLDGAPTTGRRFLLTFRGEAAYAPAMSRVSRETGVDFSILSGRVGRLQSAPYGRLIVSVDGGDVDAALAALRAAGVEVEEARQ
jgi:D-methionine transport system ATP-binding protein